MIRTIFVFLALLVCLIHDSAFAEEMMSFTSSDVPRNVSRDKAVTKSVLAVVPSGRISGMVAEKITGIAAAGIRVTAKPVTSYGVCEGSSSYSVSTDVDGYYEITGLPDGPYRVSFAMGMSAGAASSGVKAVNFISQWYGGEPDESRSPVVWISSTVRTVQNINALMENGGSVSGMVSDVMAPLASVEVTAVSDSGTKITTTSDMLGRYTISGLASGSYTVTFKTRPPLFDFPVPGLSMSQYVTASYPSPVAVHAPEGVSAVNMIFTAAQLGGSIKGTISSGNAGNPLIMSMVSVRKAGTYSIVANSLSFSGTFSLGGLPDGSYDVVLNDTGSQNGFAPKTVPGIVVNGTTPVDLGTVVLQPGGEIGGRVTSAQDGAPLADVYVLATSTLGMGGFAMTGADGVYALSGLPSGSYSLQYSLCRNGYLEQWYNGKASEATANPVSVTAPTVISGINAAINLSGANSSPVAYPRTVTVGINVPRAFTLEASDADGNRVQYSVVTPPLHGVIAGNPPNLVYSPSKDFSGSDQIVFKANDGKSDSNSAVISFTVGSLQQTAMKGDVNSDGTINIVDVILTLQHVVGLGSQTAESKAHYLAVADVAPLDAVSTLPKGDGVVALDDALMILKRVLKLEAWVPVGGGTTLSLVVPHDAATGVSTGTPVQAVASKPLDSAVLTDNSVVLRRVGPYGSMALAGAIEYNEARKEITLRTSELQDDYLYNLVFSGLKDLGGYAVPDTTFTFATAKNPFKRSVNKNPDGSIEKYSDCILASPGNPLFCAWYSDPGADGTWFTVDDTVLSSEAYHYNNGGALVRTVNHDSRGTDNVWFTADDHILSYRTSSYNASGTVSRITFSSVSGSDGAWFTADDTVGYYEDYTYDSESRLIRIVRYAGSGVDTVWFTADDEVYDYEVHTYDPVGRPSATLTYTSPGTDLKWFTGDDTVSDCIKNVRTVTGQTVYELFFSSYQTNAAVSHADIWSRGEIFKYKKYVYDTAGRTSRIMTFGHPGRDLLWNTADDLVMGYCSVAYDSSSRKTGSTCYKHPGVNGIWFDVDDMETEYEEFTAVW